MPITAFYAALLAPLFILLSFRVIRQRRSHRIGIGHGESTALLRAMRVHANFAEYTPLVLVLLGLAESLASPAILLHAAGATFLAGRAVHAYGVSQEPERLLFRVTGMSVTFTVLAVLALACLYGAFQRGVGL